MRRSRLALLAIAALLLQPGLVAGYAMDEDGPMSDYVVLYASGVSPSVARAAVAAAHGSVVSENVAVGLATVRSWNPTFLRDASRQPAIAGVARNVAIGRQAPGARPDRAIVPPVTPGDSAPPPTTGKPSDPGAEPLAGFQWDMAMMHATPSGSYKTQRGKAGVRVGIIDTGVDGRHPDIAPNFDATLSRNFTTDIPSVDGPCEHATCVDPVDEDGNGHGTHVAGTIGASINGLGIAGVAPDITLVNLRAGQDSGFFFLPATVDALTYAADNGIDVVNLSFFVDPWLFNCAANPANSPDQQMEQRTIIEATNRALDYAHDHGVTLIVAAGNDHTDLDAPTLDATSPDYPAGSAHLRSIDDACLLMPVEGNHVIAVSSVGPSTAKADYSNYGYRQTTVSAPGGWFRDLIGTPRHRTTENLVLSAYPESIALANGVIAYPGGPPLLATVVRDCQAGTCAYYQWLQGTSMAAPHVAGVAALIVSEYGQAATGQATGQLQMDPAAVERKLRSSATNHPCPDPALITYSAEGQPPDHDALCTGTPEFNSIWGDGIVDALAAVSAKKQ